MKLGFAELRRTRGRFAAIAGAVAFIVFLALILSALGDGLYLGQTGVYRTSGSELYVYEQEAEAQLQRSTLDSSVLDQLAAIDGVSAVGALGTSNLAATTADDGTELQLSLVGAEGAAVPAELVEGRRPAAGSFEVIADEQMQRRGIDIGSVVTVTGGPQLTVVGVSRDSGFGFDTLWTDVATWDAVRSEVRPELASLSGTVQAVAVDVDGEVSAVAAAIGAIDGLSASTVDEAIAALPAAEQQKNTLGAIVNTTFLVAAIVIGLFFALVTLEKRNQFAVLKAIGMSSRKLLGGVFLQAVVASIVGYAGGFLLSRIVGAIIPADVPALFLSTTAASVFVTTVVTGALGALLSFRRIVKIDPATAIGGAA